MDLSVLDSYFENDCYDDLRDEIQIIIDLIRYKCSVDNIKDYLSYFAK